MLTTTVTTIMGILQAAQAAQALYNEIKSTLSTDDQAAVDAQLAKLIPQEEADEQKAESDLQAAGDKT